MYCNRRGGGIKLHIIPLAWDVIMWGSLLCHQSPSSDSLEEEFTSVQFTPALQDILVQARKPSTRYSYSKKQEQFDRQIGRQNSSPRYLTSTRSVAEFYSHKEFYLLINIWLLLQS
uniref:Uncharacterized protein n=1 Tax=Sphaerodactylus townsendi TaxID=933632 RepID=A0ACB8EC79_9SAUR